MRDFKGQQLTPNVKKGKYKGVPLTATSYSLHC